MSDASVLKMKGKLDEQDVGTTIKIGSVDESKCKKLEMPIFGGVNPESQVHREKHFFEINDLAYNEKKVAVVSFVQDKVNWYRWSNNRKKVTS